MILIPDDSPLPTGYRISQVVREEEDTDDENATVLVVGNERITVGEPLETCDGSPPKEACETGREPQRVEWSRHEYSVISTKA
jgi:hypothetical protein